MLKKDLTVCVSERWAFPLKRAFFIYDSKIIRALDARESVGPFLKSLCLTLCVSTVFTDVLVWVFDGICKECLCWMRRFFIVNVCTSCNTSWWFSFIPPYKRSVFM